MKFQKNIRWLLCQIADKLVRISAVLGKMLEKLSKKKFKEKYANS